MLAASLELSDDAIVGKDLNGIVTCWNAGAERIFGYTAKEMVGRPITLIIPPELQADELSILDGIRSGQKTDHFETVRLTKSGERIDISLTVSPVRDKRGKIIGAAKIARDITERKKLELALRTSEKLAARGRLAATVAHEVNSPLETITNLIYLAKNDPHLPENVRDYLQRADEELRRVAHIGQQTLGFYRDTSFPVRVVLSDAVTNVLFVYKRKIEYKKLSVETHIETGLSLITSRGDLTQILSNLIANAIDASYEGGKVLIAARVSRNRHGRPEVRIIVADGGTGISPENKQRLFVPFFTTKKGVGTGLGLWLVKDLLEKKGGQIRVRSSDQSRPGTIVSVFLPSQALATTSDGTHHRTPGRP